MNAEQKPTKSRRRNGKVARLPKAIRERINQMMADGRVYLHIIAELGEDGKTLNEDSLANWKSGGYAEWLKEQRELEEMRLTQEYAVDLARESEATRDRYGRNKFGQSLLLARRLIEAGVQFVGVNEFNQKWDTHGGLFCRYK